MTNLRERQSDEVDRWATSVLIYLYVSLSVLWVFLFEISTIPGQCAYAIVSVLLFLPFSQPIFFLLFTPRKEPLGEKHLLLGRIIGLVRQVVSLIMFFAGGYFGWLISTQLDELSKKLSALDKTYAADGASSSEKEKAVKQVISDMQDFIKDQADIVFGLLSVIIAAWIYLLMVDLIRGRIDGDLMESFRDFDSLLSKDSLADEDCECIKLVLLRAYFWYRKSAEFIAKLPFLGFLLYLLVPLSFAALMFGGIIQELHNQFNEWLSTQMGQL